MWREKSIIAQIQELWNKKKGQTNENKWKQREHYGSRVRRDLVCDGANDQKM